MPNPVQKHMNGEELTEVSTLIEDFGHPYHRNVVQSTQSEQNGPGLDTSLIAKRLALASAAAESVFNNPDVEPEFVPDDIDSARAAVECLESLFASVLAHSLLYLKVQKAVPKCSRGIVFKVYPKSFKTQTM